MNAYEQARAATLAMKAALIYGVGHTNEILYSRRHPRGNPSIRLCKTYEEAIRLKGERLNVDIGAFNGTAIDVVKNQVCRAIHEASVSGIDFSRVGV